MDKEKVIDNFKQSRDYRDICYFIDHVSDLSFRESLLEELGYHFGLNVCNIDYGEKYITVGKKKEIRIQITPKYKKMNLAKCVILKINDII